MGLDEIHMLSIYTLTILSLFILFFMIKCEIALNLEIKREYKSSLPLW